MQPTAVRHYCERGSYCGVTVSEPEVREPPSWENEGRKADLPSCQDEGEEMVIKSTESL